MTQTQRHPQAGGTGPVAHSPHEFPARTWRDVAQNVKARSKRHQVPLLAAGVAFYAMLALFPALAAFLSIYGLVADPQRAESQVEALAAGLPGGAGELVIEQSQAITQAGQGALTLGVVVSVLLALWTASSGTHGLMQALTLAYDEQESRGLVKRRGTALALTFAGVVFFGLAVGVIIAAPPLLSAAGLGPLVEWTVRIGRWVVMAAVVVIVLGVVYRYAPDRAAPQWRWVTPGTVAATALWVLGSVAFSFYVANFGAYNETYGALGAVIVLLLWLFLSAYIVILGAETNAELERQTPVDTTAAGYHEHHVADRARASSPR